MTKVTRRNALAGAAAGLMIVKPETAFGSQANSKVNFGVIGTGGRGRYVGTLMTRVPNAQIAAICDKYPDRVDLGKTQIPGADKVPSYKDLNDLLARRDVDAVLIATPVYLHPEHFELAAKAGKHIYCEKPAGADVAGVKRLLRAAESMDKSKTVAFGFQQRFSPEYLAAYKTLKDPDKFGRLNLMTSYWVWGGNAFMRGPEPLPDSEEEKVRRWTRYKETSGDFIVEQDCHGVDILNWFSGSHPLWAYGDGGNSRRTIGNNTDHVLVSYMYPNELKGWLIGTQLPPTPWWDVKEQFFGDKGAIEVARTYFSYMAAGQKGKEMARQESKREITNDAVEAFFKAIADGKPFSMARDACDSTFTSLLGRMACEKRREITWDEMLKSA